MDKKALLKQARTFAQNAFNRIRPAMTETLTKARATMVELCAASAQCESRGEPVTKAFTTGLNEVIEAMMSFRSGYASNDPTQAIDPKADPQFAINNLVKSASGAAFAKRVTLDDFISYASETIRKADALAAEKRTHEALDSLSGLLGVIKANEEDVTSGILIPTSNDPDAQRVTSTPGSLETAQPAPSGFAANPAAVGGPAPSGAPAGTSVTTTNSTATDPTAVPPAATGGPAASTANVETAASGAPASGAGAENSFAKAATVKWPEDMNKTDRFAGLSAWGFDLTRPEFMTGTVKHDLGKDEKK